MVKPFKLLIKLVKKLQRQFKPVQIFIKNFKKIKKSIKTCSKVRIQNSG